MIDFHCALPAYFSVSTSLFSNSAAALFEALPAVHLSASVATIDEQVSSSGVRAGVRHEVDVRTLQLFSITISAHWNHALPQVLDVLGNEVRKAGIDVAWRDRVDTSEVSPFVG